MDEGIEVMVEKTKQVFRFEQQLMEELRAQRVCTALVSSPTVVASSHIGGNEQGRDSIASTEIGGTSQ